MDIRVIEGDYRYRPGENVWRDDLLGVVLLEGIGEIQSGIVLTELAQCSFGIYSVEMIEDIQLTEAKAVLFQLPFLTPAFLKEDVRVLDEISSQVINDVFFMNHRSLDHQRAALELVWYQVWNPQSPDARGYDEAEKVDLVQSIVDYLKTHLDEPISLDWLAEHYSCEKAQILSLFRKSDYQSPMKLLAEMRVKHVRSLLERSQLTIAQIANRVGYNSLSTFNHFFKRHTNMSPREYREKHQWLL